MSLESQNPQEQTELSDKMTFSLNDDASTDDKLEIENYIKGLAQFVESCSTPLSVSIQGDWGTGKTSIMKQIEKKLNDEERKKVKTIWFNTWQFSQFNLSSALSSQFLLSLVKEVTKGMDEENKINKDKVKVTEGIAKLLKFTDFSSFLINSEAIANALMPDKGITPLESLKADFQKLINTYCENNSFDRIVIFIDDLDRVSPRYAIELMEIIKLFLDCEKCIFVIAIDESIVSLGLEEKYPNLPDEKKESFFDKIIQVPFSVPVSKYDTKKYFRESLEIINISIKPDISEEVDKIIIECVDKNPRAIKRIINSYSLSSRILKSIGSEESNSDSEGEFNLSLFYITVLQNYFEDHYNELEALFGEEKVDEESLSNLISSLGEFGSALQKHLKVNKENFKKTLLNVSVFTYNNNTLGAKQERFWKGFIKLIPELPNFNKGKVGRRRNYYLYGKDNYKGLLIELYLNKKSVGAFFGIYRKNSDYHDEIEKIESNKEIIIKRLTESEIGESVLVEQANYYGYKIVDNLKGQDVSSDDELFDWFNEKIEIFRKILSEIF